MKTLFAIGGIALALILSACTTGQSPTGGTGGQIEQEAKQEMKRS